MELHSLVEFASKLSTFLTTETLHNYLSYGGFKWLKKIDNFDVNSISECNFIKNSSTGHILKVDFEYPDELLSVRLL